MNNPEPLAPELLALGSDGTLLATELLEAITNHITKHPRSAQKAIGPSEVGQACGRRLAYKMLGHEERERETPWLPTIGTAVHAWLEEALDRENQRWIESCGQPRYYTERRVNTGEYGDVAVTGSADAYDRVTATVIDWKIVGPTTLKKYRSKGPGSQYRTQAHLYGRGFSRAGLPVERVMIVFLPRNGKLEDAYIWHEPYDETVATEALQRLAGIALAVNALGTGAPAHIETVDDYCGFCPFFRAGSTDPAEGCAGHPRSSAAANPFSDLLAG